MQISEEADRYANARTCIDTLDETLTMTCEEKEPDMADYGSIWMLCVAREEVACFSFLKQIADVIYTDERDRNQNFNDTHYHMTLHEAMLQTENADVVNLVIIMVFITTPPRRQRQSVPWRCHLLPSPPRRPQTLGPRSPLRGVTIRQDGGGPVLGQCN